MLRGSKSGNSKDGKLERSFGVRHRQKNRHLSHLKMLDALNICALNLFRSLRDRCTSHQGSDPFGPQLRIRDVVIMPKFDIRDIGLKQFHIVSSHRRKRQEHFRVSKIDADAVPPAFIECHLVSPSVSPLSSQPALGFECPWIREDGFICVHEKGSHAYRGSGGDSVLLILKVFDLGRYGRLAPLRRKKGDLPRRSRHLDTEAARARSMMRKEERCLALSELDA